MLVDVQAAGELTGSLAETLIDRVLVFPGERVDIAWKTPELLITG